MSEIFQELAIIGYPVDEEDRVTQVIGSLPESYDMLVTALEACSEIPNMESITEKIIHEERKIKEKQKVRREEQAHASQRFKPDDRRCFYCNQSGHIKKFCKKFLEDQEEKRKKERKSQHSGTRP